MDDVEQLTPEQRIVALQEALKNADATIANLKLENRILHERARLDEQTGLIKTSDEGREYIFRRLEQTRRDNQRVDLIRVDIDDLGGKNRALGHDRVDELLPRLAKKLEEIAGENGIAMRFHTKGDEFGLMLFGETETEIEKKMNKLKEGFDIEGEKFEMSVGRASVTPENMERFMNTGELWDELAREADIAERRAKIQNG